jgi:hypothetical protein
MLPEWHEQLRSGDQGFWFRAIVATESAEVTGIPLMTPTESTGNGTFTNALRLHLRNFAYKTFKIKFPWSGGHWPFFCRKKKKAKFKAILHLHANQHQSEIRQFQWAITALRACLLSKALLIYIHIKLNVSWGFGELIWHKNDTPSVFFCI